MMALKAEDGNDIQAHLDAIHLMYEQLAGMNAIPSKDDYMTIILGSLPATYSNHLFSLSATTWINNRPLTTHDVSAYAIELYDLRKLQSGAPEKQSNDAALHTQEKGNRTNAECFNCNKRSHFTRDCWAKGGRKESQHPKGWKSKGANNGKS